MNWRSVISDCILVLAFGFGVCVSLCGTAEAVDWPNWRGPNYDGISSETGWVAEWPKESPEILWRASLGTGFSSIVVSDGKAYAMGNADNKDTVFCFDAETGKEIWKYSYPQRLDPKYYEGGTLASPTVAAGKVYTVSKDGKAFCLDAVTGKIIWKKNLLKDFGIERTTWGLSGSPLIIDNMVIFNAGAQGLALNKADGSLVWKNGNGPGGYATAVPYTLGKQKYLAMFGCKHIIGLTLATGKECWNLKWQTEYDINAADPIISGDKMFISSGYDNGCALLKISDSTATEVWRNKDIRNKLNGSVLWQGYIYGVDEVSRDSSGEGGELKCLDFKTGQVQWSQKGFGLGSLMLADGKLIVLSDKGRLVIAEATPEKFKEISSAQILTGKCWTVPVLANGRIYTRNAKGNMVCVDVRPKTPTAKK